MADTGYLISHFYVAVGGSEIQTDLMNDLIEVTVESSLHLPDVATLVLHDTRLRWVDDQRLEPGKTVRISAKADQKDKPLFDGEIVEIEPDFNPSTQRLVVRAFDRLHRLARGRHVRSFKDVTDGDLVQKIAGEVGLRTEMGPATQVHPYVLQANETNLEFLAGRAAALGYLLYVDEKTLYCVPPAQKKDTVELKWAEALQEFRPRLTTVEQVGSVTVRGWDPDTCKAIVGQARNGKGTPKVGEQRPGGDLAQKAFNQEAGHLVADRPIRVQTTADRLAQAVADGRAGNFIQAEGRCAGNPAINAGALLRISAVGDRFSGDYFVTGATHVYNSKTGYSTEFSISGHQPSTLLGLLRPEPKASPRGGLVVGIVTDNQDPQGQGRVKVKFPWFSEEHASHWARVAAVGGGADRGIEFLPEINDEVLVGFELGDMHYPYIVGGLWNGRDAPPKKSDQIVSGGKVQQRILRSRTGHLIILDDKDGAGGITIQDRKGNRIVLGSGKDELTVEVQGNARVKAGGNVEVEAQGSMRLQAQGQVEIKGTGVKIDGGAGGVDVDGAVINLN